MAFAFCSRFDKYHSDSTFSYATARRRVQFCKPSRLNIKDEPHCGHPTTSFIKDNSYNVEEKVSKEAKIRM